MKKLKIYIALMAALYTAIIVSWIYLETNPWEFRIIKNKISPIIPGDNTEFTVKDLDDNHKEEIFRIANDSNRGYFLVSILDTTFNVLQESHFLYKLVDAQYPFRRYPLPTVDVNKDGWEEVIVLCHNDSVLFLNILDAFNNHEIMQYHPILKRKHVVSDQNAIWDEWDLWLYDFKKVDLNNDGVDELVLALNAAKAEWPRGVFIIDLVQKKIINKFISGVKIQLIEMADFNHDGKDDFVLSTNATGNIEWPVNFPDSSMYVIVVNDELETIYSKRMGTEPGNFIIRSFRNGNKTWHLGQLMAGYKEEASKLLIYDENFIEKYDRLFEIQDFADHVNWNGEPYILTSSREKGLVLFKWDWHKQNLDEIALYPDLRCYRFEDVLGDNMPEIWAGNAEHLYLLDMDLNVLAELDWYSDMPKKFREKKFNIYEISSGLDHKQKNPIYYLSTHNAFVKLALQSNPVKYYSLYFSPFIFLIIFGLLLFANRHLNRLRILVTFFYHSLKKSENAILLLDDKGKVITFNNTLQILLSHNDYIEKGMHFSQLFAVTSRIRKLIQDSIDNIEPIRDNISFENEQSSFIGEVVITPFKYFFNVTNSYLVEIKNTTSQVLEDRSSNWQRTTRKMIHDIKNPLSAVQLNIQTLYMKLRDRDTGIAEELKPEIDMAYSELKRVRNISRDFLKFSDIEKTQKESFQIAGLLNELLVHFQAFQTEHLTIETEIEDNLPEINADRRQLEMALQGLLENAIDAIEDKNGRVLISVYMENDQAQPLIKNMIVQVSDSGQGISDSYKNKIFEPHFSTKSEGTGMGLVFVKHIIQQHKGEITVESREGFGTTVTLKIPVV